MKFSKKKFLLVAGLALLVPGAALTACGNVGNMDVDQVLPTDDPTSQKEIVFWHCMGHAKSNQVEVIAKKFNEDYAGKYHVTCKKLSGTYDGLSDAIKKKISGGETPALSMGYPDNFSAYMTNNINRSVIYRLDNFIKDPNYGYSEEEIADFVPEFYKEGSAYQFEGTWSMPMYKSTEIMFYNAAYFAGDNDQNKAKFEHDEGYWAVQDVVAKAAAKAAKGE